MGFKLSLVLGLLLIGTASGSFMYIKYLNNQIATLNGNQVIDSIRMEQN